jgi:hypothetical protein
MLERWGGGVGTVCNLEVIVMLMRTDPLFELDRLAGRLLGTASDGSFSDPNSMPMDAYREEDQFIVHFDLPGVAPEAIELDVERSVLTVKARSRSPARTSAGNWPADPRARRLCFSSTNRGLRAGVTNSGGNGGKGAC